MSDPVLEFPFSGGFDESVREEVVDASSAFTTLENIRQNKTGGADKRPGYVALASTRSDGTERSAGCRIFARGDQVCVIDGTTIDVYSDALGRWVNKGRVPEASVSVQDIPTMGTIFSGAEDVTHVNGYLVVSYLVAVSATASWHYTVIVDAATGAQVRQDPHHLSSHLAGTRVAHYGNYAILFTADSGSFEIYTRYLDLTSATTIAAGWTTIATFTGSDFSNSGFDVAECASNDRVAMAYSTVSASGQRISVKTLNISGVLETRNVATTTAMVLPYGLGLSESGDTLWLAWADTLDVKVLGLNPTDIDGAPLASQLTAFTMAAGVSTEQGVYIESGSTAGTAAVFVTASDGVLHAWRHYARGVQTIAGAAATNGVLNEIGGALINSRPFLRNGRFYAHVTSPNQDDAVLCDITPNLTAFLAITYCRPVAAASQRGLPLNTFGRHGRTAAIDSSRYAFGLTLRTGGSTYGNALAIYDFADPQRWEPAQVNGSTYLGGGVLSVFDGARVFEAGFLVAPTMPVTVNSSGTGLDLTNGRRYVATYEEVDADGNWHVSGVSTPCGISGPQTNKAVLVSAAPCSITSRGFLLGNAGSTLRVTFYATLDANNGREPYYRVGSVSNDPNTPLLTFSDTLAEDDLAVQPQLYGTGNLPGTGAGKDHRAPPGLKHIASYNGMFVGANDFTLCHSSQPIDGEGLWFCPAFMKPLDNRATGVVVQDGAVVVFSTGGCVATSGDPPSDNAQLGGLATPRRLSVDAGCIDARSLLTTSKGTFYQSRRGIELLIRSQTNTYIGARVQDTAAAYPVITAAALDMQESMSLVRFSLAEAEDDGAVSGAGRDLVFDLNAGIWQSSDVKHGNTPAEASQNACVATVGGVPRYCWLGTNGVVYAERAATDVAACLDGTTWVRKLAITPWVHIAGMQGEQFLDQVLLLAKRVTAHQVTIEIAFDYSDSFTSTKTFTDAQIAALAREWLVREVSQTTSQAIRVRISDSPPTGDSPVLGTGAGGTWVALTFSGMPHRGPKRSSGAQRGAT